MTRRADELSRERYISLATFRRDGRAVETPVWCVGLRGKLYVFTEAKSAKVKRIRATAKIKAAPCGALGKVRGPWVQGTGRVVEDPELIAAVYRALDEKYGWQMRGVNLASRLAGRIRDRAIIELSVK